MRLKNKSAVITAAGSGMGEAGCEAFAREGASVVAVDIDEARLRKVVDSVNAAGGQAHFIVADLLDAEACRRAINEAAGLLGGIDILWNHAGMPGSRDMEELDLADYARCMDLNIRAGLIMVSAAVPFFRKRGGGSVIFTASAAGLVGASSSPVYSAAKFGVVGLAKSLALRYAAENIRVNSVCPGPIETPMFPLFFDPKAGADSAAKLQAAAMAAIPMGRLGRADEVAKAALWLASDDASFVTGVALPVDGGFTAK